MAKLQLIDAVQSDNLASLQQLIESGADVNEQDEQGWTPLSWAAGKGNSTMVNLLIANGADVWKFGRDQRTPYMIALAAGHVEVLDLLQQAEQKVDAKRSEKKELKYCRAVPLGKLRQFDGWTKDDTSSLADGGRSLTNDDLLFLHHDYSVTESIWHNEKVIFAHVTTAWKEFCRNALDFRVPNEIELVCSNDQ
jgi:hypothetical protein